MKTHHSKEEYHGYIQTMASIAKYKIINRISNQYNYLEINFEFPEDFFSKVFMQIYLKNISLEIC